MKWRLMIAGAALLFATGGAAIKGTTLTGWQTAGARSLVAAIAMLLFLQETRRGWSWRVLPVAAAYAATLISFVLATKLTTAANAIFLQATAPVYLLFIGPLLLREAVRRVDYFFCAALGAGVWLMFHGSDVPAATAPNPALGNLIAVGSGFFYALMLAGLRWLANSSAIATAAAGNLLAFLFCLPQALPIGALSGRDTAGILYLGVVQIAVAYWLLTRGMKHVTAFETSTLLLVEPVANPIFTWIFLSERPGPWALAGGAVILLSTYWKMRASSAG